MVADETPLTAFADAIREFEPSHILIALREHEHAGWQERRLVDEVRQRFKLPLTIFDIDAEGHVAAPESD